MKLKYQFVINEVAEQFVAVAVGEDMEKFNGFIKTNDVGAEMLEILKDEVSLDELIAQMLAKHPEASEQEASEVVNEFVNGLKEKDLLA